MQSISLLLIAISQAVSAFQYPCSNYVGNHHHDAGRRHSQVVQTLRFSYGDIKLVPKVLADIQEEIEASCPKLDRGTAQLKSYEADHIQTEVNYHFDIPPSNQEYGSNREQVLLAIGRAIEKNNVTFAIPAINYVNTESAS